MQIIIICNLVVILYFLMSLNSASNEKFKNPKTLSNQELLAAISRQASVIHEIDMLPKGEQFSMKQFREKRKAYIKELCLEAASRPPNEGQIFIELTQKALEIESTGIGRDDAAVQAVKEVLLNTHGDSFPISWATR